RDSASQNGVTPYVRHSVRHGVTPCVTSRLSLPFALVIGTPLGLAFGVLLALLGPPRGGLVPVEVVVNLVALLVGLPQPAQDELVHVGPLVAGSQSRHLVVTHEPVCRVLGAVAKCGDMGTEGSVS